MNAIVGWFLLIYLLVFFGLAFCWRSYLVWRQTGVNPYRLKAETGAEHITGRYFRLLPIASLLVVLAYLFAPGLYRQFGIIAMLDGPLVQTAGVVLLLLTLAWIGLAQAQMGKSWRIGLDQENPTELVTEGVFSRSRNPIFVGMIGCVLGFFLAMPNALTLTILALDVALIQVQVSLEEEFLLQRHGDNYRQYCSRVRRWL